MKKYLILALSFVLLFAGCKEDEISTIKPDGDFAVNFDFPTDSVFAPGKVVLTNRSKYSDKYSWSFPEAKTLNKEGLSEITTSEALAPDTLFYELPGTYKVTLRAWQGGKVDSITKEITVSKLKPQIIVPANIGIELEKQFKARVFKYENLDLTYSWDFGEPGLTSTEAEPKVVFKNEGNHTVTLTINDGVETLTSTVVVFVQGELVKTIYFTDAITNKLYKYQFKQFSTPTVTPLPTSTGPHPLNISVYNNRVFISDAGEGIRFTSVPGDGRIFSVDLNGGNQVTLTSHIGGSYGDDPFNHTIDEATGTLYFSTRFGGVRTISTNAVDSPYPTATKIAVTAAENDGSSTYGWLDGGLQIIDGNLWYSKHGSAGRGLYKFNATTAAFLEKPANFATVKMRAFKIDTANNKIYFSVNFKSGSLEKGFYRANLDGSNIQLLDAMNLFSTEGGDNEQTHVTGIAIDYDPDDKSAGYVYWGYRDANDVNASGTGTSGANSGIKRYALDGSKPVEFLLKGYAPYGIAIDNTRR